MLCYFGKQRRKESIELKEHEQETNLSRPTCSTSAFQSTEFDSAEERINLDISNIASDDIVKILLLNRSNNVDKLHLIKNAFRPVGEAAMTFDFKKCCTAKGQRFRYLNEMHFRTCSWLVYLESRKSFYCKYCAIFFTSLVNCGVGKNRLKAGKLVIKPLCSFNKLTGSDGYLYDEHNRLEYHNSMTIEVRWWDI